MHDSNNQSMTIRERLERTLAGKPVVRPVYGVYDWFVENRHGVDWQSLINLGLGRINHANITRYEHPHVVIRYDGQLRAIADDIAALDLDGIDSFTEAPEGNMTIAEARARWPEKFLWVHPNLGWYSLPDEKLAANIRRAVKEAGPSRFCLQISEEVPDDWERTVPAVLRTLSSC